MVSQHLDGRTWKQFPCTPSVEVVADEGVGYCVSCGDRLTRGTEIVRVGDALAHADEVCVAELVVEADGHA